MSSLQNTREAATQHRTSGQEFSGPRVLGEPAPENARSESIRTEAYLLAEARGFEAGHEIEDWLEAERRVNGTDSRPH